MICQPSLDDLALLERIHVNLRADWEVCYDRDSLLYEKAKLPKDYDFLTPAQKLAHYRKWRSLDEHLELDPVGEFMRNHRGALAGIPSIEV